MYNLTCRSICLYTCVSACMCACLSVYRGRIWDVTVYRLVVGLIFIIDSSSGCSPMAGCKPNQCYNILILYGYLMLYTCNTTIPHTTSIHTTSQHTQAPNELRNLLAFAAPLMGIFVLGLCVGVVRCRVVFSYIILLYCNIG